MKIDRIDIRVEPERKRRYAEHARERGLSLGSWLLNAAAEQYQRETAREEPKEIKIRPL